MVKKEKKSFEIANTASVSTASIKLGMFLVVVADSS